MAVDTVKRNARQHKWAAENMDRPTWLFRKGTADQVKAAAEKAGLSASKWVQAAIDEKLARDGN